LTFYKTINLPIGCNQGTVHIKRGDGKHMIVRDLSGRTQGLGKTFERFRRNIAQTQILQGYRQTNVDHKVKNHRTLIRIDVFIQAKLRGDAEGNLFTLGVGPAFFKFFF
jgi:hypothetical protein